MTRAAGSAGYYTWAADQGNETDGFYPIRGWELIDRDTGEVRPGYRIGRSDAADQWADWNGVGEIRLPSVTHILDTVDAKPGLTPWAFNLGLEAALYLVRRGYPIQTYDMDTLKQAAKQEGFGPFQSKKRAGRRGSDVHAIAEALAAADPGLVAARMAQLPEEQRGYGRALLNWWAEAGITPLWSEITVWSLTHGFAGTFDLVSEDGTLWDYKTSPKVYPSHAWQLGAYALALHECRGYHVGALAVVRLGEDGTYEVVEVPNDPEPFLAALRFYRATKPAQKEEQ